MRAIILPRFGTDNLQLAELDKPMLKGDEVLVRFAAAAVNSRDAQIIAGTFSPDQPLPIVPVSDGAGIVEEVGKDVDGISLGDLVCPLFFPEWLSGEALADERLADKRFKLVGHTDYRGDETYNMELSKSRAESARQYLMEKYQIDPERIAPIGMGESQPMMQGNDANAMRRNRRVELELVR